MLKISDIKVLVVWAEALQRPEHYSITLNKTKIFHLILNKWKPSALLHRCGVLKRCDGHPGGFDNISGRSCEFILTSLPIYTSFYFGIAESPSRCTLIYPFTPSSRCLSKPKPCAPSLPRTAHLWRIRRPLQACYSFATPTVNFFHLTNYNCSHFWLSGRVLSTVFVPR